MKTAKAKTYVFWIVLTELVGAAAGLLSRRGIGLYKTAVFKPAFSPPSSLFPIVWTILYLLMGIAAARVSLYSDGERRRSALRLYAVQLGVNFLWPLIFFNLQAFGPAFLWLVLLWALIVAMTLRFRELDRTAANLQIPYLIWVLFAGYLNYGVWMLNK